MHLVGPETNLPSIDGTFTAIMFDSIRQVNKWLPLSWLNPNQQFVWQALSTWFILHATPDRRITLNDDQKFLYFNF